MFVTKDQFVDDINSLIKHLQFEEQKEMFFKQLVQECTTGNELYDSIGQHMTDVIKPSSTSSKDFTYRSSIVSLYGFLENFLEKLVEEFITSINTASIPITTLPDSVRNNHLDLSLQLLKKNQTDRTQTETEKKCNEKDVIKNLNSFLQEEEGYSLNSKSYSIHTANFRFDQIQSFFLQVGVERIANRALNIKDVKELLAARQQQEPLDNAQTLQSWLEIELNDLAQLRNEIAHGAFERPIESLELVIERAEFIKQFGSALADILYRTFEAVIYHSVQKHIIGNADQTFPNYNCFGFIGKPVDSETEKFTLKVGDLIFSHNDNSDKKVITGKVMSLRLNKIEVQEIQIPSDQDFSIQVDFDVINGMINRKLAIQKL